MQRRSFGLGNAGNMSLTAQEAVRVTNANIFSEVATSTSQGKAGDILITAPTVDIAGKGFIGTRTFGTGDAGEMKIQATVLNIAENSELSTGTHGIGNAGQLSLLADQQIVIRDSSVIATLEEGGIGEGGDVLLNAPLIMLTDQATVGSGTLEAGNAGEINVTTDILEISNGAMLGSSASSSGDAGAVTIQGNQLRVLNNGNITSRASEQATGSAGSITIRMRDRLEIIGSQPEEIPVRADGQFITNLLFLDTGIFSNSNGSGDAGAIDIQTDQLIIRDGGLITSAAASVRPNAGQSASLNIQANDVSLSGLGGLSTATLGSGNASNLNLQAETITLERGAGIYSSSLGLSEFALPDLEGQPSGSAYLNSLSPEERSAVLVSLVKFALQESLGGDGIILGELLLSNLPTDSAERSRRLLSVFRLFSPEGSLGGDGGDLIIQANQLAVNGGSRIAAETFSAGSSGQLQIQADRIQVAGTSSERSVPSAIRVSTQGSGSSQSLVLVSNQLQLSEQGLVSAATSNLGAGGNITIDAQRIQLNRDATITASAAASGAAGRIDIQTTELNVANGSQIQTNTEGPERAGDLRIEASYHLSLADPNSGFFARTGLDSSGQGGNLNVTAPEIQLDNSASIAVDSQGQGQGGSVTLSSETLSLGSDSRAGYLRKENRVVISCASRSRASVMD